jgi:hypothetical protein
MIPDHALGSPCCVRFPCVHAAASTPVQQPGVFLAHLTQLCQPSPEGVPGRPAPRPLQGLLGVHLRCGLNTRAVTVIRDPHPKASDISSPPCLLRLLPAGATRRVGLHPLSRPCGTERSEWIPALRRSGANSEVAKPPCGGGCSDFGFDPQELFLAHTRGWSAGQERIFVADFGKSQSPAHDKSSSGAVASLRS